jgi:O-antigen/teichoic acid export membrane protein
MGLYAKIRETVSEAAIFGVAPLVASATGFFLTFVYARYLRPSDLGHLALLLGTESFATQILGFGMTQAFFRSYFDDEDEARRRRITGTTLWFLVAVNLAFVALSAPLVAWYAALIKIPDARLVALVVALTAFDTVNNVPFLILKATRRSKQYVAVKWVAAIAQFVVIVALVAWLHLGLFGAMVGWLVGTALQTAIYFAMLRGHVSATFSFADLRPMLWLGVPMIFNALATKVLINADRFFINHYVDAREVGLYELANKFASILPILITNPFSLIWPAMRFQVMKDEDADEYYALVLTYLTFLSLYFGLGVAVLVPDLIRITLREEYWGATPVVPLFVLYYLFVATGKGVNVGLMTERKAYWNPIIVVSAAVVNIALNVALIPRYGMMGAAWATVVAYGFMNWFRWYMSTRYHPVAYEWGRIAKMTGLALAMYALIVWIPVPNLYLSFALRFALAATFPFALAALGFFEPRERARFAELWTVGRTRAVRLLRRDRTEHAG